MGPPCLLCRCKRQSPEQQWWGHSCVSSPQFPTHSIVLSPPAAMSGPSLLYLQRTAPLPPLSPCHLQLVEVSAANSRSYGISRASVDRVNDLRPGSKDFRALDATVVEVRSLGGAILRSICCASALAAPVLCCKTTEMHPAVDAIVPAACHFLIKWSLVRTEVSYYMIIMVSPHTVSRPWFGQREGCHVACSMCKHGVDCMPGNINCAAPATHVVVCRECRPGWIIVELVWPLLCWPHPYTTGA